MTRRRLCALRERLSNCAAPRLLCQSEDGRAFDLLEDFLQMEAPFGKWRAVLYCYADQRLRRCVVLCVRSEFLGLTQFACDLDARIEEVSGYCREYLARRTVRLSNIESVRYACRHNSDRVRMERTCNYINRSGT
jgi:hypothetical protein